VLIEEVRRKPNRNNRIHQQVEQAVVDYTLEQPAHGPLLTSNQPGKRSISASPA
jgi:hypothetical protein